MAVAFRSVLVSNGISVDSIEITTMPTKTSYREGDTLDITGIVVTATADLMTGDVAELCEYSPTVLEESGTQEITVSYGGQTTSFQVTVEEYITDFANTSWSTIQKVGALGTGSQYWSIGDSKTIVLDGKIGARGFNNYECKVFIVDFNHDNVNGVYCQGFRTTSNVNVSLISPVYGGSRDGTKQYNMMHWGSSGAPYSSNYGGWKGCDLRYDILGSTDVAPSGYGSVAQYPRYGYDPSPTVKSSPVPDTLMSAIPAKLRNVLAPITVYTDNVGNKSTASSSVTSSIDYFILLSEYEILGTTTYANENEANVQTRYAYYDNSTSSNKVKYKDNAIRTSCRWLTRCPRKNANSGFVNISEQGIVSPSDSYNSYGLSPVFRVA